VTLNPTPDNQGEQVQKKIEVFTGLLVLVGALQAVAAFFQYSASKESANTAKQNANTAVQAIEINRPFIVFDEVRLEHFAVATVEQPPLLSSNGALMTAVLKRAKPSISCSMQ
jgi:hypothetical protein